MCDVVGIGILHNFWGGGEGGEGMNEGIWFMLMHI